ncbi:nuclear transport factor 2 family protein [Actinocorallia longicatena]|uniref:SnoaL-like domain-containing protein n=1 Tax=Actinocorallia longicatena TaxID=111803 RepID=A0ABP6Q7H6_9ACTN
MSAEIDVVQEMITAWNELDWLRVEALFAPDGVLHSVMHEPIVGREAIAERLALLAEGLIRLELRVESLGEIDGKVFVQRVDVFDTERGGHAEVPVVGVLTVRDGLVAEWLEYYDRPTLLRGMGLAADFAA